MLSIIGDLRVIRFKSGVTLDANHLHAYLRYTIEAFVTCITFFRDFQDWFFVRKTYVCRKCNWRQKRRCRCEYFTSFYENMTKDNEITDMLVIRLLFEHQDVQSNFCSAFFDRHNFGMFWERDRLPWSWSESWPIRFYIQRKCLSIFMPTNLWLHLLDLGSWI